MPLRPADRNVNPIPPHPHLRGKARRLHALILRLGTACIFTLSATQLAAQPDFVENEISADANGAISVFAADIDRDGDIDVLAATLVGDEILWFENDGHRAFFPRTITSDADGARSVFAADVDSDGDVDVLSASRSDDKVAWYENDGMQLFTERVISTTADGAFAVFATDLDEDGDVDVVAASEDDDTIAWYENNGNQVFSQRVISNEADRPQSVFGADMDGDGDIDVLSASLIDNEIAWYRNDDNAASFERFVVDFNAVGATSVFATDMDNDGDTDILSSSRTDDTIAWYENDGQGVFTKHPVSTTAQSAQSVFAIDLDNDGDKDILSASADDDKLAWYEALPGNVFAQRAISLRVDNASSVFAADLDGDGDNDVIAAASLGDRVTWYRNSIREFFAPFEAGETLPASVTAVQDLAAVDLDADGDIDLLSASDSEPELVWHENNGIGQFEAQTLTTVPQGVNSVSTGDLDNDGDLDVVVAAASDNDVLWFEQASTGSFVLHTLDSSAGGAVEVRTVDLDGDSDRDVVAALQGEGQVVWYENLGSATFTRHTVADMANVRSVFPIDLNRDGSIDILSASGIESNGLATWHRNDGSQNFSSEPIRSDVSAGGVSITAADLDHDGDIDVVTAFDQDWLFFNQDPPIIWHENDGQEQFSDHPLFNLTTSTDEVRVADVDADGNVDILAASASGDTVALLRNDGNRNFALTELGTEHAGAASLVSADFDRDGDDDIVAAGSDEIVSYENASIHRTLSFGDPDKIVFGRQLDRPVVIDLDGDGRNDLIADERPTFFRNDGALMFTEVTSTGPATMLVLTADLDRDGDQDIINLGDVDFGGNPGAFRWHTNSLPATPFLFNVIADDRAPEFVGAVDLDGDADLDLLGADRRSVVWYENDGNQNFSKHTLVDGFSRVRSGTIGDFDSDGDIDLAVYDSTQLSMVENQGSQNFVSRVIDGGVSLVWQFGSADVDRDGDLDLVVPSRDDTVAWYENRGNLSFTRRLISEVDDRPGSIASADFDQDGNLDLMTVSDGDLLSSSVTVYRNRGFQTFSQIPIANISDPGGGVTADLDKDGDADIISTSISGAFLHTNCGGQLTSTINLENAQPFSDGALVELFRVDLEHGGIAGDSDIRVESIALRLVDDRGFPLTAAQVEQLLDELRTTVVETGNQSALTEFDITPVLVSQGIIRLPIDDLQLSPSQGATVVVEALVAAGASQQSPDQFRVDFQETPGASPMANDVSSGAAIRQSCPQPVRNVILTISGNQIDESDPLNTSLMITATASAPVIGKQRIELNLAGTGVTPSDYSLRNEFVESNVIEIDSRTSTGSLTLIARDDALPEGTEEAVLSVVSATSGIRLDRTIIETIQILDNDEASLAITTSNVVEGDSGTTMMRFVTTLTGDVQDGLTVPYSFDPGLANPVGDYNGEPGLLVFAGSDGEEQTVDVEVFGDTNVELDESVIVVLGKPSNTNVTVTEGRAVGLILNDDQALLSVGDALIAEGDTGLSTIEFTVNSDKLITFGVSLDYATADATATVADDDYVATSGTLLYTPQQQTISVQIVGDTNIEKDESFDLLLSNIQAPGDTVVFADALALGRILNDDGGGDPDLIFAGDFELP